MIGSKGSQSYIIVVGHTRREDLQTHRFMGLDTVLQAQSVYTICTIPGSDLSVCGFGLFVR